MQGLNGIFFHGLLKSTVLIVSNDAPAAVKIAAMLARIFFGDRIQICNGVNDHLEIQAGVDALPAAGGEIYLLEGTYYCEVTINLDSYQTFRGCGRSTILTTTTDTLTFLSAAGGAGTELTGITVEDIKIDGGADLGDLAISFVYVDYSTVQNVYIETMTSFLGGNGVGIFFDHADWNTIRGCTIYDSKWAAIYLDTCNSGIVTENICDTGGENGIYVYDSIEGTVSNNELYRFDLYGIYCDFTPSINVSDNTANWNSGYGFYMSGCTYLDLVGNEACWNGYEGINCDWQDHALIANNYAVGNSQDTTNTYDDIRLNNDSNYCYVVGNCCRAGGLANVPRYGLSVTNANCDKNVISDNDIWDDGFGTGSFYDIGTLTTVEDNNRGIRLDQIRHYRRVQNTSGVQRVAGDVVSLKAVANGYEVTAPAAVGERQVFGMVAETIANNAFGMVLTKGKTTVLKSTNAGGGNIVIGDNLITEIGVRARKAAAATDPIFARALEACAAADCTIDAYIKSPWD